MNKPIKKTFKVTKVDLQIILWLLQSKQWYLLLGATSLYGTSLYSLERQDRDGYRNMRRFNRLWKWLCIWTTSKPSVTTVNHSNIWPCKRDSNLPASSGTVSHHLPFRVLVRIQRTAHLYTLQGFGLGFLIGNSQANDSRGRREILNRGLWTKGFRNAHISVSIYLCPWDNLH